MLEHVRAVYFKAFAVHVSASHDGFEQSFALMQRQLPKIAPIQVHRIKGD
jgi:hypothetical protein